MVSLTLRIPHVWVNSPTTTTDEERKRNERRGKKMWVWMQWKGEKYI
jgi:hypothetical protein